MALDLDKHGQAVHSHILDPSHALNTAPVGSERSEATTEVQYFGNYGSIGNLALVSMGGFYDPRIVSSGDYRFLSGFLPGIRDKRCFKGC